MLNPPSKRRTRPRDKKMNLVPILDAVFILVFFLLMSASFLKIYEIPSDIPLLSNSAPPKKKKVPLALTLKITESQITLYRGIPSRAFKSFGKVANGDYDLEALHNFLITLKKQHLDENTIIFEPLINVNYETIVKVMDAVRDMRKTDPSIYLRDKDGNDQKLETIFGKIIFGNVQS